MVPETRVFQAADGENLDILAFTVFAWSTHVTDGRTELRWLRRAESIAAFARKNDYMVSPLSVLFDFKAYVIFFSVFRECIYAVFQKRTKLPTTL